ncbi:class IV adenylate cyclase [Pseudodesulfovibrio sp. zrk46]|uniref:class IV adenylate cyclase n=1 Tax=Pseudodesulfovibrio sp. zrk46 TaxID=2725288 RepID=UPI001448F293|nr:class IV adenylate cyclase [Pseudodesulfovibrio sp. zrk46]QJB57881.1 class IV adenylate cyclase [Pseudodesulfovibrio sp. zrk46]
MVLECELKYLEVNLNDLSERLHNAGGESSGRYFESNIVFDYPDRSLKEAGVLLRLREKKGEAVLTVKKPPETDVPSSLKVFEEIESVVEDFDTVKRALEAVGFRVAFAYEKVREKWRFMDCVICLDHLPYGDFVEIEGTEETVHACAKAIDIGDHPTSKSTYHALNLEYRSANGMEMNESFVFAEEDRRRFKEQFRKD